MIIWQGRGWVVAVVGFSCLVLAEFASEALTNDSGYYQDHRWPMAVACAAAVGAVVLSVDSDYVEPWACDRLTVDTGRAAEDNLRAVLDYLAEPV